MKTNSAAAAFGRQPVKAASTSAPGSMRAKVAAVEMAGAGDTYLAASTVVYTRRRNSSLRPAESLMLLSQLTIMCQAGVDVAEALRSIAAQATKANVKAILLRVCGDVEAGLSLAEALHRHRALNDTLVAAISAGEQAGALVSVLERLTQLLRNDIRTRGVVWSMLTYPLVLCGVTGLVLAALVFFVLPQFAQVFRDIGKPAPPLTQALLYVGETVRNNVVLVLGAFAGCIGLAFWMFYAESARRWWDYGVLHAAIIRRSTRALLTGRVFRLLGTMLQTGIPLLDAVRLCQTAAGNLTFRRALEAVERDVLQGKGLGNVLASFAFLPDGAAQMVKTAEKTGKLGQVLQTVGEYFEDEGERSLRDLIKLLEPTIIIALGGLVALVVMAVMLPLLDVSTMSH